MQLAVNCHLLRDALVAHVTSQISVEQLRNLCVVTLPVPTVDGRLVDIFVEPRSKDFFLVHDGGKAANELILHGVEITPSINERCLLLAERFGISWSEETFQSGCKIGQLSAMVMSVGMSSSLAMTHLLGQALQHEQEPIRDQFRTALKKWSTKKRISFQDNVKVDGVIKQHRFDFVAYPKNGPIAISILSPSVSAISAADRFALKALDLKGSNSGTWRPVAVRTHAELWSDEANQLVDKLALAVVDITSGEAATEAKITGALAPLLAAA